MEPEEWGPMFWPVLHIVSFYYPDSPSAEEMEAARDFFFSLSYLLPCDECCGHYSTLLDQFPIEPALVGRQELSRWVYNIHSQVNKRLGRRNQPTYDQVRSQCLKLQPKYGVSPLAREHQERLAVVAETQDKFRKLRSHSAEPKFPFAGRLRTGNRQINNPGPGGSKKPCKDCAKKRLARGLH
jgi:hypothetical protein